MSVNHIDPIKVESFSPVRTFSIMKDPDQKGSRMPAAQKVEAAVQASQKVEDNPANTDDAVKRARNGNLSAVRELYLDHHEQIYRFIWSRVHDPDLAEDLTGEVFVRMLKNLSSYEDRSLPFSAWLYTIARNLVIDYHRKNNASEIISLNDLIEEPSKGKSLEDQTEHNLTFEQVRRMLKRIKPDEREVLELRFLAGLSLKETALVTNKTVAAVKALQHRGLVALRAINQN